MQIDLRSERIGLRFPVEVGLVGETKETLHALLSLLRQKATHACATSKPAWRSGTRCSSAWPR
ncbi:hypothetical protein BTH42_32665 [Burkholderia sp. SRS-W-2-2016]|uniref:hypothetical protein n=1 Tax=Burkholderia sp. SRS-W-2-2016 TaxID=1926878 RepID=UPI00094AB783|nr:hypothetical protein [Burkholderia sp. SRS-W-2-2016]OLL27576.1 hypothetical protein BTH42_32665 [Burkholderia sp. SRS-W-2-2016]